MEKFGYFRRVRSRGVKNIVSRTHGTVIRRLAEVFLTNDEQSAKYTDFSLR
jgi:hypothetical protein